MTSNFPISLNSSSDVNGVVTITGRNVLALTTLRMVPVDKMIDGALPAIAVASWLAVNPVPLLTDIKNLVRPGIWEYDDVQLDILL